MAGRKPRRKPLGTIWEIPDELWLRVEPILKEFWPKFEIARSDPEVIRLRDNLQRLLARFDVNYGARLCPRSTTWGSAWRVILGTSTATMAILQAARTLSSTWTGPVRRDTDG